MIRLPSNHSPDSRILQVSAHPHHCHPSCPPAHWLAIHNPARVRTDGRPLRTTRRSPPACRSLRKPPPAFKTLAGFGCQGARIQGYQNTNPPSIGPHTRSWGTVYPLDRSISGSGVNPLGQTLIVTTVTTYGCLQNSVEPPHKPHHIHALVMRLVFLWHAKKEAASKLNLPAAPPETIPNSRLWFRHLTGVESFSPPA